MLINGQEGSAANYSEMSPIEIFEKINNHQLKGIMFHDSLISLFDFLYLPGFKRWQMCQLRSESEERCEFKHYVMRNHHKLLKDAPDTKEEIIPEDWYQYTRFDVTPQLRRQYVESAFIKYKEWENKTKALYEQCSKVLYDNGNVLDACKIQELAEGVEKEDFSIVEILWDTLKLDRVGYQRLS